MEAFTLSLGHDGTITGLVSICQDKPDNESGRPLIVALHGGTYSASYFNVDSRQSLARVCGLQRLSVVCVTRPGYGDSSRVPSRYQDDSYLRRQCHYIHEIVLPAIWKEYGGAKTGTSSLALYGHSIGAILSIMIAAVHGSSRATSYPLSGIISSGTGCHAHPDRLKAKKDAAKDAESISSDEHVTWSSKAKDHLLLSADLDLCPPSIVSLHPTIGEPSPAQELMETNTHFRKCWRDYAREVRVPHLNGLPEHDRLVDVSIENLQDFKSGFTNCPRMSSLIIASAPHDVELSYVGPAWMSQAVAFATECGIFYERGGLKPDAKI